MSITISPTGNVEGVVGLPTCFEAAAIKVVPQEDERYLDAPSSGTNWTYNSSNGTYTKVSGALDTPDAGLTGPTLFKYQPFYIEGANFSFTTPASPNRKYSTYVGVFSDTGAFYGWQIWKNCGAQSTGDCNQANGDDPNANWKAYVYSANNSVGSFTVNFSEKFRLRSDGINLNWDVFTAGSIGGFPPAGAARWVLSLYSIPLPVGVEQYSFTLNSLYVNNQINNVRTFKGSYQGQVPVTWSAPLGGDLTPGTTSSRMCFTSGSVGTYQVCVESAFDPMICVEIVISPLYLILLDYPEGGCVFTDEIVKLKSNGGQGGVLTALDADGQPVGTVIDALTWQAPSTPAEVTLTYTIGEFTASLELTVVKRLRVLNVDGNIISGLIPGETYQLITNYDTPPGQIVWENLDCPNIVSPTGLITIPKNTANNCFGSLDCYIRVKLYNIDGTICENLFEYPIDATGTSAVYLDFRIMVDPIFPTPEFGGPVPTKWKPETPDYRVIINEFEGGCDETYIRNRVGVYKWTVNYTGLKYESQMDCPPEPCCDDTLGYVGGYGPEYQAAARLDEFWNLVLGQSGYFTVKDMRTGIVWRKVRFDASMERDHINWKTIHSRTITLVWKPCCATGPAGGSCRHITTVVPVFEREPVTFNGIVVTYNGETVYYS